MSGRGPAWFPFSPSEWLGNLSLQRCSLAARGMWIETAALSAGCDRPGRLASQGTAWSNREVAEAVRGSTAKNLRALEELDAKGVLIRDESGAIWWPEIEQAERSRQASARNGKRGGRPRTQAEPKHEPEREPKPKPKPKPRAEPKPAPELREREKGGPVSSVLREGYGVSEGRGVRGEPAALAGKPNPLGPGEGSQESPERGSGRNGTGRRPEGSAASAQFQARDEIEDRAKAMALIFKMHPKAGAQTGSRSQARHLAARFRDLGLELCEESLKWGMRQKRGPAAEAMAGIIGYAGGCMPSPGAKADRMAQLARLYEADSKNAAKQEA